MSILWKYLEGNQELTYLSKGNKEQFLNTYKNTFLTTKLKNSDYHRCNSWGRKESDMTELLNWTEVNWTIGV